MRLYLFCIIIIFIFNLNVSGQGLIVPELPYPDSVENPAGAVANEFYPVFSPATELFTFPENQMPDMGLVPFPKIDFNQKLLGFSQDYSYSVFNPEGFFHPGLGFVANPFVGQAAIFNQAAYKISDRFTVGGNSFGYNDILSSPLPSKGLTNYNYRGASMFLQYKVSKNIKIETRVSVNGNQF